MYSGSRLVNSVFAYGAVTRSGWLSQNHSADFRFFLTVLTPRCTHHGLGSFLFARRYSGNRCFFLFLRLLRCFSSPGSLPYVMDWRMDDWSFSSRVSPFRNLRVIGYLLLAAAYRSLSRLSSALSAKASTLRSLYLDHFFRSFRCFCFGCLCIALQAFLRVAGFELILGKLPLSSVCIFHMPVSYTFVYILGCLEYLFILDFLQCVVFKVHSAACSMNRLPVEITRFELVTPCLQGRCSPN